MYFKIVFGVYFFLTTISYGQMNTFRTYGGTSTINVLYSDRILIASDGMMVELDDSNELTGNVKAINKIQNNRDIFFTFTGKPVRITNPNKEVVFDICDLMSTVLNRSQDLDAAFTDFNRITLDTLNRLFEVMPPDYVNVLKSKIDKALIEGVIVTFRDGRPFLKNWDIGFVNVESKVELKIVDKPYKGKIPFCFFTGNSGAIKEAMSQPAFWVKQELTPEMLIELIKLQIAETPKEVGFPIHVVTIFSDGTYERKICEK